MTERKRGFTAQVMTGGKITIPIATRKVLGVKTGDMVDILEIQKVEPKEEK